MSSATKLAFRHDFASLKKAVEDECYMCTRVWDSLSTEQQAIAESPGFRGVECRVSFKARDGAEDGATEPAVLMAFSFLCQEEMFDCDEANAVGGWSDWERGHYALLSPSSMCLRRHTSCRLLTPDAEYPVLEAPRLGRSTNCESGWNTVSQWTKECCSSHPACVEPHHRKWAPTRLIDIRDYDQGHVRVVRSSTVPDLPEEPYVALSHCWGLQPFPVLHERNKAQFEDGLPASLLAPNFQDAIFAARKLGFRYIWIDSLCIIQGSIEDWRHEAPLMNKVYRNALLTLSAMDSPDAYGGLFRGRDPDAVSPHPFGVLVEGRGLVEGLLVRADLWESNVRQAPLSQRAWAVQERILAPRSLYFCRDQLFWECRELRACEVFPGGLPLHFVGESEALPPKAFERAVRQEGGERPRSADGALIRPPPAASPYEVWNDILALYVRCALTRSEDKLVALSGVAKDFGRAVGDEYVAGLWRRNLINSLLWRVDAPFGEPPMPSSRPRRYRAPTWSWAVSNLEVRRDSLPPFAAATADGCVVRSVIANAAMIPSLVD